MQTHLVKREHPNKTANRVGRGGKRGKTAGRGHKGQKARAGNRPRPEIRDLIKKLPKRRGHGKNRSRTVNSGRVVYEVVNIGALEVFEDGATITPLILLEKELVKKQGGKIPPVKILGNGDIKKKLTVSKCKVSASAEEKIKQSGGTIL